MDEDTSGRLWRRPYRIPSRGWWQVLRRVWETSGRNNISVLAAGCAFFAVFALFPAISGLVSLYVLWADPATVETHLSTLQPLLPDEAYDIVLEQTKRIVSAAGVNLELGLVVSLALAFWSASRGTYALIAALNVAYEEDERRSWLSLQIHTLAFTIGGILCAAVAMTALVYLPIAFAFAGLSAELETVTKIARWPLLTLLLILALAVLYKWGPCRRAPDWHWVSVGSVAATLTWLLVSAGFSLYVENFADYSRFYGSLGAVIVLLFWLYLSFLAVLLGAEINAELEHQTSYDTTIGRSRPMGERGAYMADHVAEK